MPGWGRGLEAVGKKQVPGPDPRIPAYSFSSMPYLATMRFSPLSAKRTV